MGKFLSVNLLIFKILKVTFFEKYCTTEILRDGLPVYWK